MNRDRYSLLGLGRPRSAWFGNVSLWATSGAIPADFGKCLSVADLRHRLGSLQPYSAVLVEAGMPGVDRDLIDMAASAGVPTIVVQQTGREGDAAALGAAAAVSSDLTRADLIYALTSHASVISPKSDGVVATVLGDVAPWSGDLVAVCGPGGTGASTIAIAAAQAFADDALDNGLVVLADLARNGEQAMLHDAEDVVPGIEELVEANRSARPAADEVRALTFSVPDRGYRLMLGVRRPERWASMPPRAIEASFAGLRRGFRTVVADITADFEGETDGGSMDVEERNALARTAVMTAGAVIAVGAPGMKGTHSLATVIRSLLGLGIEAERIVAVVNRAPKSATARAEIGRALASLIAVNGSRAPICGPLFIPERAVDNALRDGARLPKQLTAGLASAVEAILQRNGAGAPSAEPVPVQPGSLGVLDEAVGQ